VGVVYRQTFKLEAHQQYNQQRGKQQVFRNALDDFFDVIVVIGHQNDIKGELSTIAEARIATGIQLWTDGRAPYIMLTSGRGKSFNPTSKAHAQWAKEELLKKLPLSPKRVITETKSRSTIENALRAQSIIDKRKWKKIIVVTSGYHMPRTKMIFRSIFKEDKYTLEFVKAKGKMRPLLWLAHRFKEVELKRKNKEELQLTLYKKK